MLPELQRKLLYICASDSARTASPIEAELKEEGKGKSEHGMHRQDCLGLWVSEY